MSAINVDAAHDFFQTHASVCSALLEDPKGSGRQFIVSTSGTSEWLTDPSDAETYFARWKNTIANHTNISFPTIRFMFYLAYEAGAIFERLPPPKTMPDGGLIWRHEPKWCVCFSPEDNLVFISSTESELELDRLELWVRTTAKPEISTIRCSIDIEAPQSNYACAVEKVREYISQGDIFQANIARFWQSDFDDKYLNNLYDTLREVNPAPFATYLKAGELTIISASPERLFSIDSEGCIAARPIAGTRKRSEGDKDQALSDELLLSEKERAEHIMLVDLERNDLGRVCVPGSIHVDECMVIEKYATVQHIVSNVVGTLEKNIDLLDVIQSMFPGGTITGCPKVRCMEIIHELEPNARGPYTGGIGYMAWDGSVDMNILIRTFWHWQGKLKWAAGAGIVADSVPEHEELETEHKVAGLMRAFND